MEVLKLYIEKINKGSLSYDDWKMNNAKKVPCLDGVVYKIHNFNSISNTVGNVFEEIMTDFIQERTCEDTYGVLFYNSDGSGEICVNCKMNEIPKVFEVMCRDYNVEDVYEIGYSSIATENHSGFSNGIYAVSMKFDSKQFRAWYNLFENGEIVRGVID